MDPVGALVLLALPAALVAAWGAQARENRRAVLRRILKRVEGTLASGLAGDEVVGRHVGRDFRLRLWTSKRVRPLGLGSTRGSAFPDVYPLEVELALAHAPPVRVRVRRDAGLAGLQKAVGLVRDVDVAGGGPFDRRFCVEVDGPVGARVDATPLAAADVRQALEALLGRWALDEVLIADGRLVARGAPELIGPRELQGLLDALEVLAHAFDRRPALELGLAARFVWTGGVDRAARCPFCKDGLDGADPAELVACARCRTVLHGECHQENQGCPILGCGERGATRAAAGPKGAGGGGGEGGGEGLDLVPLG